MSYIRLEDFLGEWRDTMGNNVTVEWPRKDERGRGTQLDVQLAKSSGRGNPIRLNVKAMGHGRFVCGHYDLDVGLSHSGKIVWLDSRSDRRSVWERRHGEDDRRSRSRSRGRSGYGYRSQPPPHAWGGWPPPPGAAPPGHLPGPPPGPPPGSWGGTREDRGSVWTQTSTPGAWVPPSFAQSEPAAAAPPTGPPIADAQRSIAVADPRIRPQDPRLKQADPRPGDPRIRPSSAPVQPEVPEPAKPPSGSPSWRSLISSMYRRFNPDKLPELDDILAKYRGAEADLYQALCDKYVGPQDDEEESAEEDVYKERPASQAAAAAAAAPQAQVIDMGELRLD
eukprot:TRINITY_DN12374_c0_g3_i1.p1 TRINITY_DN12374_c0_g3~~TRINITY_DN12374_c0_g3_i1.p1  ORF type:complete len:337 (+),score=55.59 TRINITY_DN12374_c0_g3_i1:147-1157(+)